MKKMTYCLLSYIGPFSLSFPSINFKIIKIYLKHIIWPALQRTQNKQTDETGQNVIEVDVVVEPVLAFPLHISTCQNHVGRRLALDFPDSVVRGSLVAVSR